jgi:phytoene dehydrogenase-like protein
VVSAAGIHPTILKLAGPEHFPADYVERVKTLKPAMGLTSQTYFLSKPVLDFNIAVAYSDEGWLDSPRYARLVEGQAPPNVGIYVYVPSNFDPSLAPPGKQLITAGAVCPSDRDSKVVSTVIKKAEELLFRLWPQVEAVVEKKIYAGPKEVTDMTRDRVIPGQGGECMGLGYRIGQCGPRRPGFQTPVQGLYLVGIDAGGEYGMGTHQSLNSSIVVAHHLCGTKPLTFPPS